METIKTKADAIREMTDEALAEYITEILNKGQVWFDRMMCDQCKAENGGRCPLPDDDASCTKGDTFILEWLRQRAE